MKYNKYPKYKDSGVEWLGEIPESWRTEKGKWLYKKNKREVRSSDGVVTCFRDGEVTLRSNRRVDGFTNAVQEHGYQGVRKGDLVIHNMDAFAGAIGVSDSDGKSTPVYSVCTERIKNTINSYYYAYFLRNLAFNGFITSLAKGIRERSTDFRFADFSELIFSYPPLKEQTAIAKYLDEKTVKIDKAISEKKKLIELLKERKQILIQNAVTKGLNPDAKMKYSGVEWIGDIPEEWEVKRLKHLALKIGSGITPSGGGTIYLDTGIPLLRSQNILFGKIELNGVAYISEKIHKSMNNSTVKKGDVLLNITGGSIGRCHYVEKEMELNVNQHVCIIRPSKLITTIFLNGILASEIGQGQIWFNQQGGGREGLNFQALKNFFIPTPLIEEQKQISNYIETQSSKIDKAIHLQEKQIAKLQEYKSVLINEVVTGKVKVC